MKGLLKIKTIITEEINGFLNEISDDEIIIPDKINLQAEYDKLNQQLFDGVLPRIPMKWSNRKGNLGHVQAMKNKFTGEVKVMHLAISSFHAMPYKIFRNTMAHEMIHVKQMTINKEPGSHGWSFHREANRINGMGLGYNITVRSEEQLGISDRVSQTSRELIAIILYMNGQYGIMVTTPEVYMRDINRLYYLLELFVNQGRLSDVEVTVIKSRNPQLQKYPISRGFQKGIRSSLLSDDILEQLLNDEIIGQRKIKRGVHDVTVVQKPRDVVAEDENSNNWITYEII
jgi:hypothetical protein